MLVPALLPEGQSTYLTQVARPTQAPAARTAETEAFQIPSGYGDHRIVLMVKDPWWLYAYWEIQPALERQARSQLAPEEFAGVQSVLRAYDVTDRDVPQQPAHGWFDIPLSGMASSWFIHANAPNRSFIVELGLLTRTGRFLMLVRSNRVTTPRAGPSEIIDEEWLTTDDTYWKLVGLTAGIGMGASEAAIRELLQRKLLSPGISSPGLFSQSKLPKATGFWLQVDTELIIRGATDPKASVTIQGQAVTLRPDGTFSIRMALPDGTQVIPVEAVAPDKQQRRAITPTVTRQTDGHAALPIDGTQPATRAKFEV